MAGLDELGIVLSHSAIEQAYELEISRFKRVPQNCFELPDRKFVKLFRLTKCMVDDLLSTLEPHMPDSSRTSALSVEEKVFASLRFFAAGSYQQDVGQNFNVSMSQPSVSRSINEVINAVHTSGFFEENVHFYKNLDELKTARQKFYDNYKFPGVIGCIDCTHVAIVPPLKENQECPEHVYVNRKHFHSINVQLICDADLKIINVNAKYPGSTHDSFIWNNSKVYHAMQNLYSKYPGNYYLLGDSGYALRPWMMTPIISAADGTPQSDYNECHKLTRSIIERVNGILKMRFRCLLKHRVLHYHPQVASKIINTCCALHNMCIENKLDNIPPEENDDLLDGMLPYDEINADSNEPHANTEANQLLNEGRRIQQTISRQYFRN